MRRLSAIFNANIAENTMLYIHQRTEWPNFTWNAEKLFKPLTEITHLQGRLIGRMEGLGFSLQNEATLLNMTSEIIKSSEIEGENLDPDQVRSSIARRLGMEVAGMISSDRNVDGVVEVMVDATQAFKVPLTDERLFGWHSALFPTGRSGMHRIVVGRWRDNDPSDPMQVVSGAFGKEKVHFEAPASAVLNKEMEQFLEWFNSNQNIHPILKAGIAHLWFVTIHPFDDGNGRLARTITEMSLARADNTKQRFYSMSTQIRQERKKYYDILERVQKSGLDITSWLEWFLDCLGRALSSADQISSGVIYKARYWESLTQKQLNVRQKHMINLLLDQNFFGNLTTTKWAKMTKSSQDTALRDIQNLVEQGILTKDTAGGRSTNYFLERLNDK